MEGCEHTEASPIGKCAICDRTVCSECYNDLFGMMICDLHSALEEESEWELVGFFSDAGFMAQRRYVLEEHGITSLVVDNEEEAVELYVSNEEKDDAFAVLSASAEDEHSCSECKIQFGKDMENCPVCGAKPTDIGGVNQVQE